MLELRPATAADGPFLAEVLAIAADWADPVPRPVAEVLADAALARYIAGWPLDGDVGVVAVDPRPVGATWWRFATVDDPWYGFVDEAVPELAIGVRPAARGSGVGEHLLRALVERAREQGLPGLSLSVSAGNPARRLYERLGFDPVGVEGGSVVMVRWLGDTGLVQMSE